jgi:NAD(P)-dependent dehydrogenase (short-subunit alcohol dehydrogenase family)
MAASSFRNRVFTITGAASGMGREMALQAAAKGAEVWATDWNEAGLLETGSLAQQAGLSVGTSPLDVADKEAIARFADAIIPGLEGRELVLINNAGVGLRSGAFADTDLADFEWLMNINLWGAIRMTKAFYPYFLARNEGHIVNISSVFGFIGVAMSASYCTSKFGLRGFNESLRMELRGTGIYTTSVHPGGIKTNIVRNSRLKPNTFTEAEHQKTVDSFERAARTTAPHAAAQILAAVDKRRERLVIGSDGRAIDLLARLLPVGYTDILVKKLKKGFGVD